jgi:hypothetical protein
MLRRLGAMIAVAVCLMLLPANPGQADEVKVKGFFKAEDVVPHDQLANFLSRQPWQNNPWQPFAWQMPSNLFVEAPSSSPVSAGAPVPRPIDPYSFSHQYQWQQQLYAQQMMLSMWSRAMQPRPNFRPLAPGTGTTSGGDCPPRGVILQAAGQCFAAGTLVHLADLSKPIEDVQVGERAWSEGPSGCTDTGSQAWRRVELRADNRDGSGADIVLIRPVAWIERLQAKVGKRIAFTIPECGFDGTAKVLAISPCPPIAPGNGPIVTGTFRQTTGQVVSLHVYGLSEPVATTANHRFWSLDRQAFVRADELSRGERLLGREGACRLERLEPLLADVPVYNLEVQSHGTFRVSRLGIIVRDAGTGMK